MTSGLPRTRVAMLMALGAMVAGCATDSPKTVGGAAIGGLGGWAVCKAAGGSDKKCALVAAGAGVAGGLLGAQLDARDREAQQEATTRALNANASSASQRWQSKPNVSGASTVVDRRVVNGRQCKLVKEVVEVGNREEAKQRLYCHTDRGWQPQQA